MLLQYRPVHLILYGDNLNYRMFIHLYYQCLGFP
jgi:hypothetical protein